MQVPLYSTLMSTHLDKFIVTTIVVNGFSCFKQSLNGSTTASAYGAVLVEELVRVPVGETNPGGNW